jgi:hypothetical protein
LEKVGGLNVLAAVLGDKVVLVLGVEQVVDVVVYKEAVSLVSLHHFDHFGQAGTLR